MDSPSDDNKQIVPFSGDVVVSSKSREEGEPSDDAGQSSESAVLVAPPPSPASEPPAQDYQLAVPSNEYGCQYCKKKFSNKQALGGHQNAHKVERLMVKNLQEHRSKLDHFKSSPSSYHGRFGAGGPSLTPYKHRYSPYSFGCNGHHHGGCPGVIPYTSRPLLPPFSGWPAAPPPGPTMGPFPGRAHYTLPPVQNLNIRLPNFGAGSSNSGAGQGRPAGGNNGPAPINLRNVPEPEDDDDSDLDLSLKLSYD